jgi:hypothetical protein
MTTYDTVIQPIAVRMASVAALSAITSRETVITRRRLERSTIAPPISPSTSVGALPMKLTAPSQPALRVRS